MITLVLGGTRSGKSRVAEDLAATLGPLVTYVATARVDPSDSDHVARVAGHRRRRPDHWATVEPTEDPAGLIGQLASLTGPVLLDSLGTWLTQHDDLVADVDGLIDALTARSAPTVVVSEEVGLAVHPTTELGRRYVDALGELNHRVATVADRAVLVVAGRILELGRP